MNILKKTIAIILIALVINLLVGCDQRKAIDSNKSNLIDSISLENTSYENESEDSSKIEDNSKLDKSDNKKEHLSNDELNQNTGDSIKNENLSDSARELLNIIDFDSLKINPNYKVSLISEYDNAHRRYYSPDKKNYIRIEYTQVDEFTYERHLYLNDSQNILVSTTFKSKWISNSKLLLNGTTIYDINDGTTTKILTDKFYTDKDYSDIFSSTYKLYYSVNISGTQIAYSFCDYVEGDDFEMYHVVGVYDIASTEYQEIARNRLSSIYFDIKCFWDESNNLYYNYDKKGYWYVAKYNTEAEEKILFDTEATVSAISPNLRYLVLNHMGSKCSLYDTVEGKILYSASSFKWYFGDEDFIYLDFDRSKIGVFNHRDKEEKVIISGLSKRLDDNYIEVLFNYVDNYYTVCFYQTQPDAYDLIGTIYKIEKK